MKEQKTKRLLFTVVALILSGYANAEMEFNYRGFGTIGVAHSDNDQADYVTSPVGQANGVGKTYSWDFIQDSKLGFQVDGNLTEKLSVNFQLVAVRRFENSYSPPEVRWAALKYQATPDLFLRIGRTAVPSYMLSDSQNLGYTFPWVRLPVEIYSKVPSRSEDGIDFIYHRSIGPFETNFQALYAIPFERANANGSYSEAGGAKIFTATADYKNLQVGLRHGKIKLKTNTAAGAAIFNGYKSISTRLKNAGNTPEAQQALELAGRYYDEQQRSTFTSIGAIYDSDTFLVMAEHLKFTTDLILGNTRAWYTTVGYHIGQFTPFINFARSYPTNPLSVAGVSTTGITDAALRGDVTRQNAMLNGMAARVRNTGQKSVSVGVRWDIMKNVDIKLQYDRFMLNDNSPGLFVNATPSFVRGSNINMISAAVDFVF